MKEQTIKKVFSVISTISIAVCTCMIPVFAENEESTVTVNMEAGTVENGTVSAQQEEHQDLYDFDEMNLIPLLSGKDEEASVVRIAGETRYSTSAMVCAAMQSLTDEFDDVIVADGKNYPDALSGGYLAKLTGSPIILTDIQADSKIQDIILESIKDDGHVFILGGAAAVSDSFEKGLAEKKINITRFAGDNRYDTNLEILKECWQEGDELLVARGDNFPDSLSGSAAGRPMMLVGSELNEEQKIWLEKSGVEQIYILGGVNAVSTDVEEELEQLASVERICGKDRWETSLAIAEKFTPDAEAVTVATGLKFPDALSGSPLAMALGSPILLVSEDNWMLANEFISSNNIAKMLVIGGRNVVPAITVNRLMYGIYEYPTFQSLGINSSLDSAIDRELDTVSGIMLEGGAPTRITGLNDYNKALGVLNYVGANYEYGSEYTAEGMLRTGAGTCFAYSELIYFMLKKLGVTSWLTIAGRHRDGIIGGTYRKYGSQHRSVIALIEGIYYDVDGNFANLYINQMGIPTDPAVIDESYAKYLLGLTDSY